MANILHCDIGITRFNHSGVSVGANINRVANLEPDVEKFKNRVSTWKAKALSFGVE